ncbi:MAG: hypothetical protein R2825_14370 [Saprospiraceae bacterium]
MKISILQLQAAVLFGSNIWACLHEQCELQTQLRLINMQKWKTS